MFEKGTVIVMDLDEFGEQVRREGLSEYKPNIVTGTLTSLIKQFVSRRFATIIYGLDEERGTEEVVIEIPGVEAEELADDLEWIRREINKVGGRITIVAVNGFVNCKPANSRREAYYGTTFRKLALKLLREAKRRGGNRVVIH